MTKTSLIKNISLACVLSLGALGVANAQEQEKGRVFMGVGAGIGGFSYGLLNAEVVAGYQYYFPKKLYIARKFRQGLRFYGSAGYSYGSDTSRYWEYSYHWIPVTANVDWTIDFTPGAKYVWGAFAGVGLGFVAGFTNVTDKMPYIGYDGSYSSSTYGVAWGVQAGGSLTIENKQRLEAGVGIGNAFFGARYIVMF